MESGRGRLANHGPCHPQSMSARRRGRRSRRLQMGETEVLVHAYVPNGLHPSCSDLALLPFAHRELPGLRTRLSGDPRTQDTLRIELRVRTRRMLTALRKQASSSCGASPPVVSACRSISRGRIAARASSEPYATSKPCYVHRGEPARPGSVVGPRPPSSPLGYPTTGLRLGCRWRGAFPFPSPEMLWERSSVFEPDSVFSATN